MSWRKEQRPEKEVSILQIKAVGPDYEGEDSNENYSYIFISKQRTMMNFSSEAFLCDNITFSLYSGLYTCQVEGTTESEPVLHEYMVSLILLVHLQSRSYYL